MWLARGITTLSPVPCFSFDFPPLCFDYAAYLMIFFLNAEKRLNNCVSSNKTDYICYNIQNLELSLKSPLVPICRPVPSPLQSCHCCPFSTHFVHLEKGSSTQMQICIKPQRFQCPPGFVMLLAMDETHVPAKSALWVQTCLLQDFVVCVF